MNPVTYLKTAFPNQTVNLGNLTTEIQSSRITVAVDWMQFSETDGCTIYFKEDLSNANKLLLDAVVAAHDSTIKVVYQSKTIVTDFARNFQLKSVGFIPGQSNSLSNYDIDFLPLTDTTITCYDVDGYITTNANVAVKTVVDFEPQYNYEVWGAWIEVPSSIINSTPNQWFAAIIAVPDLPSPIGSVPLLCPTDLSCIYGNKIKLDGRTTQTMKFDQNLHTNKLRLIIKHPALANHPKIQVFVETFI